MTLRPLEVVDLGHLGYLETLELQRSLRLRRIDGSLPHDILLLVEHDPVYTLGRGTQRSSLPVSEDELMARGAAVVEIERGGDVTWHGPGQLVGYPILHLSAHREGLHWYLRTLEDALIQALALLEIPADRVAGKTGVWTNGRKIASMGIHVKQWVTMHGFALNVEPDLTWFDAIVPCGLTGVEMTSVAAERNVRSPSLQREVRALVIAAMATAFGLHPRPRALADLLVQG